MPGFPLIINSTIYQRKFELIFVRLLVACWLCELWVFLRGIIKEICIPPLYQISMYYKILLPYLPRSMLHPAHYHGPQRRPPCHAVAFCRHRQVASQDAIPRWHLDTWPREDGTHVGTTAGSSAYIKGCHPLGGNLNCHVPSVSLDAVQSVSAAYTTYACRVWVGGGCRIAGPPIRHLPGRWRCQRTGDSNPDCNLTTVLVRRLEEL